MSKTEQREVAAAVLRGFRAADDQYARISGGWRLHTAPEYLATVKIGEQVAEAEGRYVTLEQNINDAVGWSGGTRFRGKQGHLPASGRFDVAWGRGTEGIPGRYRGQARVLVHLRQRRGRRAAGDRRARSRATSLGGQWQLSTSPAGRKSPRPARSACRNAPTGSCAVPATMRQAGRS